MSSITLRDAHVEFPVYNAITRSLKGRIIGLAVGGVVEQKDTGVLVVKGISGVNLSISHGERVGLIGHNGSGKTTLLRVLSGIYKPTQGTAEIDGDPVSLIGISLGIDGEATGRENIRLRAAMMGMSKEELAANIDEIAEFSGLGDFLDMPLRTYSSGMQLRLAFSISTAIRPDILIMDEWLSTGDEDFKQKADARLSKIVSATNVLVLASHSKQLILNTCDRVIWMNKGSVYMDGPAKEVANAYFG